MNKKNKIFSEMDPVLKGVLGFDITPDETPLPKQPIDPVADAIFEAQWGFPCPVSDGGNAALAKEPQALIRAYIKKMIEATLNELIVSPSNAIRN